MIFFISSKHQIFVQKVVDGVCMCVCVCVCVLERERDRDRQTDRQR